MSTGKKARIVIILLWLIIGAVGIPIALAMDLSDLGTLLYSLFATVTFNLCWVGFPIGFKWFGGRGDNALEALGLLAGCVTMCFSLPIAIFQVLFKSDW